MNKINIFGNSEKAWGMEKSQVLHLLSSNTGIAINQFGIKHPEVEYIIFTDSDMALRLVGNYSGQKIITNVHLYETIFKKRPEFNVVCTFEPNNIQGSIGNSGFWAMWYAVQQGYTAIDLYGVLDSDMGYTILANGMCRYFNAGNNTYHYFQERQYSVLKQLIENGFNGKAKICRPLLKN